MKVLHLIDSGGLYGAEKMLLTLINEQKKSGLEPVLLSCGVNGEPPKPLEVEAEAQKLDLISWRMKSGLNILGMIKVIKWAKANNVDVLHSHGYKFNVLIGLLPKFFRRKFKWIVTVHGFIPAKPISKGAVYQLIDKKLSRLSDHLCLVSPAMLEIPEFKNTKCTSVVLNGISSKKLSETTPFLKKNDLKLLVVGRLSPEKGIGYLISALADLQKQETRNYHLTVMGDGPLQSMLLQQIKSLGLSERVTLAGFVEEPARLFAEFDCLIMPSLTEGVPITLLEALREEIPVIASRVGGIPYVLGEDYKYLVEPESAEQLAQSMKALADEPANDINELVQTNAKKFFEKYTAEQMNQAYLAVYNES